MSASKKLVIGNWKMSPETLLLAKNQTTRILKTTSKLRKTEVVVAPAFVHLVPLMAKKGKVSWGAQDVFQKTAGSFTGEVSTKMLLDIGVKYVILGHSERRAMGETNETVALKASCCLADGLKPVICVGESLRDDDGKYLAELKEMLLESIQGVQKKDMLDVVIAYEPVFAIGAEKALDSHGIHTSVLYLRKILSEVYSRDWAESVKILYGGSVNVDNAEDIIKNGGVNGLLIGRESLKPEFGELLTVVDKA